MRQILAALVLGLLVAAPAKGQEGVLLASQQLLPPAQRLGTFTSASVEITPAVIPEGAQWVALRLDMQPRLLSDPATKIDTTLEFFDSASQTWRTLSGSSFTGGPGLIGPDGGPLQRLENVNYIPQIMGMKLRITLDCKSKLNVGVVADFYDIY